ncbi:hypothetical protein [Sphingomonas sanxanigenens]|uniref:Uncharacterized protein n=1 Tax=Sphingomonas sanxanigenens DSM 19645 = NX02 TaxID=1123269 RepID=W0AFZ7_9SPHN|nr:hypothetical protein [Sphingomonas sanxanigenens]AHE56016.1 hypothetical protein NX02_21930 [Sphingomonas sanxanigenens DSM 19645 = NX02]
MLDTKALADATAAIVREFLAKEVAPLIETIKRLEAELQRRAAAPGADEIGSLVDAAVVREIERRGLIAVDVDQLREGIPTADQIVSRVLAALPAPASPVQPDMEAIRAAIDEQVRTAVSAIPAPQDGASVTVDDVRPLIDEQVRAAVAAIPAPQDGTSVTVDDVRPLLDEQVRAAVAAIPTPKDGIGLAAMFVNRAGECVATMTDGTIHTLGQVVGRDADMAALEQQLREMVAAIPVPKDGRDAMSLDDFTAEVMEDGRTIRFAMKAGDTERTYQLSFPVVIDRGVWQAERAYEAGDGVTWAGSYWIAQRGTDAKPDTADSGFRLAVKRGRDGKDKVA